MRHENLDMKNLDVHSGAFAYFGTCISCLQVCINKQALAMGKHIHAQTLKSVLIPGATVHNTLLNMYAKCGSLDAASDLFSRLSARTTSTWTIMIAAYVQNGEENNALGLFWQMQQDNLKPNAFTFVNILSACRTKLLYVQGKLLHAKIMEARHESSIHVSNSLIDMYAKCGSIEDAWQTFNKMPIRDTISWNALIGAYVHHGSGMKAIKLFYGMQLEHLKLERITFVNILCACATEMLHEYGKKLHADILKAGYESDIIVGTNLIHMYTKCNIMGNAGQVFDSMLERNTISWNATIANYAQRGDGKISLKLLRQMQSEGQKPNESTFSSITGVCTIFEQGKLIHSKILEAMPGLDVDVFTDTALVDMYCKCGSLDDGLKLFLGMPVRDSISWKALISEYADQGNASMVLGLFEALQQNCVKVDDFVFVRVLNACASLWFLGQGKQVHSKILRYAGELDVFLGSALVDMYAKCGSICDASKVFEHMPVHDIVSWNALIAGYGQFSGKEAMKLVKQMEKENVIANNSTFVAILAACIHAALLKEGCYYFLIMTEGHSIMPTSEHYAGLFDILGHAGHLCEAEEVMNSVPFEAGASEWTSLLCACTT